jgi:hypothetical protein
MLTYENLAIGQRVEVLQHDQIVYGTVLYKGQVVGRPGLWIGVDLATPDGDTERTCLFSSSNEFRNFYNN